MTNTGSNTYDAVLISDPDELAEISAQLIARWEVFASGPIKLRQRGRSMDPFRYASIFGLCAYAHQCGQLASVAYREGLHLAALTPVRAAYESAITAVWLAQMESASGHFLAEYQRNQTAAAKTLMELGTPMALEAARTMLAEVERYDNPFDHNPWSFVKRVGAIEGGTLAYALYRSLSKFTHADLGVVDSYFADADVEAGIVLRATPGAFQPATYLYLTAASLVWAGSATNYLDEARVRRQELRDVARRLGVSPNLYLTSKARIQDGRAMRRVKNRPRTARK